MTKLKYNNLTLLCGFSRSGTTWLAKIIDSDPNVFLVSEPDKRQNTKLQFSKVPHCVDEDTNKWAQKYYESMSEIQSVLNYNVISYPIFNKNYAICMKKFRWNCMFAGLVINKMMNKTCNKQLHIGISLLPKKANVRFVWKSVNQSSNLSFLNNIFPHMKFVYIIRNPYDAIMSSLKKKNMSLDGEEFKRILERKNTYFFKKYKLNVQDVKKWSELTQRALRWRVEVENAIYSNIPSSKLYVIRYEDLLNYTQKQVELLFEWLGWPITSQTIQFIEQSLGKKKPHLVDSFISSGYFGVYRKESIKKKGRHRMTQSEYQQIYDIVHESPVMSYWA